MDTDYFLAGVMLAVGAVLLVLAFGFLDSGGVEVDEENVLMWDDYREIDDTSGILGTNGAVEIVTIGGTTYVHAKDTGYGTIVYENGRNTEYKIERATADLVIMNGQSNAAYYRKNVLPPEADKAPAPKIGTSYYFGQLTDPKINYQIQSIEGYQIYDFIDPETGVLRLGDKGPEFCKEYTEATGHKAIWLSMGIIAKRVSEWLPPSGSCWQYDLGFMEAFNEQLEQLPIDVDRTIMMWAQGESDKNAGTSIDTYKQRFVTFFEAAPSAWGHDIDACYMIQGRTAKMGAINTALAQLADEHEDIKLAVPASLIDTFSIENGLMYSDDLHYEQPGENAIANAAARFVVQDLGFRLTDPAPIYLMETKLAASKDSEFTPPDYVRAYNTDGTTTNLAASFSGSVDTSAAGTVKLEGTATVSPARVLPYAPAPLLIVDVVSELTIDGLVYSLSDNQATVIGCTETVTSLTIPSTISKSGTAWNVTKVGESAFYNNTDLTDLSGDSIVQIQSNAFYGCASLTSVSLPAAETLRLNSFRNCPSLTSVSLPAATLIGESAFQVCTSLASVSLPAATTLDGAAFYGCASLTSVSLPAAETLGNSAFNRCTSLTSVSLPAENVGARCFRDCGSLTSVSLPAAKSIGADAFDNCTSIASISFGNLTTVSNNAFPDWTFYDTDGTTILDKTVAANLANSTFEGTAAALIKVAPGAKSLPSSLEKRVAELTKEHAAKLEMLTKMDPALAELDATTIAKMTAKEIAGLSKADVKKLKEQIEARKLAEEDEK